jgi:uncharacterized RDD family membrane protein YckC
MVESIIEDGPGPCAVCGEPLGAGKTLPLFGHRTHKGCRSAFDLRRESAYVIDFILIFMVLMVLAAGISVSFTPKGSVDPEGSTGVIVLFLTELALVALFLAKDSVNGVSFGKLVTGLQVVDADSGRPIGLRQSIQRNLILLVPMMPIVLAFQMRGGPRIGEGWASTRVVIRKRRDAPAFAAHAAPPEDWSSGAGWASR